MRIAVRLAVGLIALVSCFGALLYGPAGRFDVPAFHAYIGLWGLNMVVTYGIAAFVHPDLIAERAKPPSDRDSTTRLVAFVPAVGHLVLAGLDVRFGWSDVPVAVQGLGFVGMITGLAFVMWTLLTNRFASSAVRLQKERAQTVVRHGPYGLVRHPMYLGVLLVSLSGGLALGSWWSALALTSLIPLFVRRTLLEDAMLHEGLDGYADYAEHVRYKVVPLIF